MYAPLLSIGSSLIRKVAKSDKYQLLYSQYKEIGTGIFTNTTNFTDFQIFFLQYLTFYASLSMDIYTEEVSSIVLEDEVYEDSYIFYKNKMKKKKNTEQNQYFKSNKPKKKQRNNKTTVSDTHVVFSKPRIKH
jgi:hypothetical protein